jgi:hypothetical protein
MSHLFVLVIVDASSACSQATFDIGATTTTSRSWDIKVTQYKCTQNALGGKTAMNYITFIGLQSNFPLQGIRTVFSGSPGLLEQSQATTFQPRRLPSDRAVRVEKQQMAAFINFHLSFFLP